MVRGRRAHLRRRNGRIHPHASAYSSPPIYPTQLLSNAPTPALRFNLPSPSPTSTRASSASNDSIAWPLHSTATHDASSFSHPRSRPTTESWCTPPYSTRQATPSSLALPRRGSPITVGATQHAYELARFACPSRPTRVCFLADHPRPLQSDLLSLVPDFLHDGRHWSLISTFLFVCTMNHHHYQAHNSHHPPTHQQFLCMATAFLRTL